MYFRLKVLEERVTALEQKMAALEVQAQERPSESELVKRTAKLIADELASVMDRQKKTRLIPIEEEVKKMNNPQAVANLKDQIMDNLVHLLRWNEKHMNEEPEQCRINIETVVHCAEKLSYIR